MIINGYRVQALAERPCIDRTKRVQQRAKTVTGNGDFGYNARYETREFTFTTFEPLNITSEDITIDLDGYRYFGEITEVESTNIKKNINARKFTYTCLLQPFKYEIATNIITTIGTTTSTTSVTVKLNGSGDLDSEPVLTVYGTKSSEFVISKDGAEFLKLKSCPGMLIIDCRTHKLNVYDANGVVRNDLLLTDFPTLSRMDADITVPAGIRLDVLPNWRSY